MVAVILAVIVILLILAVIVVTSQPSAFAITRTTTIAATPAAVFAQVNDFHKWQAWSPWAKMDPQVITSYEGADSGVGASYTWSGNKQVGAGRMTITESHAPELIRIALAFTKPMVANNIAEFTIISSGDHTIISWTMTGTNGLVAKAFGLVVNVDQMVGGEFDKGLAAMKRLCEGVAQPLDT
jgi:uncharacterized protein YndB with AHSA1/START domain